MNDDKAAQARCMGKRALCADEVRRLFLYDPATGLLTRNPAAWRWAKKALTAGNVAPSGYRIIKVYGHIYPAHCLVWLHVKGEWQKGVIDHINGNRSDNRIENLRDVAQAVNCQNRTGPQKNSTTGVLGVSPSGRANKPWRAQVKIPGTSKVKYIGLYKTVEEASAAYLAAKRAMHPGCTI